MEDLGFPARWKAESNAAIAILEEMTGQKFETASTKPGFTPVTSEARELAAQRKASGYYQPEQVAARLAEKRKAGILKALAELEKDRAKTLDGLESGWKVDRFLINRFGSKHGCNLIYYTHTNTLTANWSTCDRLMSKEEFDEMERTANPADLPEGMKWEWMAKPRH
jgi:hypothetical protein